MNEEHELVAWYESAERENVTEDLTVTHVHTTDGKVTLGRDWLAVDEGEAEWEPVIEVLHDSVAETFEPLTVPVDTAVSALVDAGLVRGGTDTARQRARGLLAYLHAEGALGLEEGAVVIDPPHDLVSSDCKFLFTYATWLDLLSMHLSERLEEYENEIADIEQGLTDEQEQRLSRIQQVDIMDRYDDFEKTAESEIESSEDILERYSKGIQSEAEIPEPEEFRLSSAPPANTDTDETED